MESIFSVELGGTLAGTQYDRLNVTGDLDLGGTLEVTLIGGFVPAAGMSFDIWDAGTSGGGFNSVLLPPLPAGLFWHSAQVNTTGVLTVSTVPEGYAAFAAYYALTTPSSADEDNDGLANELEYALGLDPQSPDSGSPGLPMLIKTGASDVFFFDMPALSAPDVELKIESGTDLLGWSVLATRTAGGPWTGALPPVVTTPAPGLHTVTLTRPDSGDERRFYRLRVRLLP